MCGKCKSSTSQWPVSARSPHHGTPCCSSDSRLPTFVTSTSSWPSSSGTDRGPASLPIEPSCRTPLSPPPPLDSDESGSVREVFLSETCVPCHPSSFADWHSWILDSTPRDQRRWPYSAVCSLRGSTAGFIDPTQERDSARCLSLPQLSLPILESLSHLLTLQSTTTTKGWDVRGGCCWLTIWPLPVIVWSSSLSLGSEAGRTTTYLPKTVLGFFSFVIHSISYSAEQVPRLSTPYPPSLPSSFSATLSCHQAVD